MSSCAGQRHCRDCPYRDLVVSSARRFIWFWSRTGGTVTPPMSVLVLSDFDTAGRGDIQVLALFEVDLVGTDYVDLPAGEGSIADPASDIMLDTPAVTLGRVQRQSNTQLTFYRSAGGSLDNAFGAGNPFADGHVYVQTLDGLVVLPVDTTLDGSGFSFARFNLDAAQRLILDALATGDRMIVAMSRPEVIDQLLWGTDELLWGTNELQWAA